MRKKERARELMRRSYGAYEEATRLAPTDVRIINDAGLIMTYYLRDDVEAAERYLIKAVALGAEQLPVTTLEGQELIDLRNQGAAILVISEELEELFEISDRIAVIANGKLSPSKKLADTNIDEIGVWMSGMWPGAENTEAQLNEGQAHV